jgi:hypothetical protein
MHESPHYMACSTKCSYSTYQFNWINPTIKLDKRLLKFPSGIIVILRQILHTIELNLIFNGPDPIKISTHCTMILFGLIRTSDLHCIRHGNTRFISYLMELASLRDYMLAAA